MAYTKKKFNSSSKKLKGISTASLATKVNQLVKQYQPEHKVHDAAAFDNVTGTGTVINVTNITSGDGQTNRDGHQVSIKSMTFKGQINWNLIADQNRSISMYIIQDTQQQSDTGPSFGDIFSFPSGELCVLNRETIGRYKILHKKKIVQDGLKPVILDFHLPLNVNVRYNNVTSTDIQKNGIYVVYISSALSNYPTFKWLARLRYTDN